MIDEEGLDEKNKDSQISVMPPPQVQIALYSKYVFGKEKWKLFNQKEYASLKKIKDIYFLKAFKSHLEKLLKEFRGAKCSNESEDMKKLVELIDSNDKRKIVNAIEWVDSHLTIENSEYTNKKKHLNKKNDSSNSVSILQCFSCFWTTPKDETGELQHLLDNKNDHEEKMKHKKN